MTPSLTAGHRQRITELRVTPLRKRFSKKADRVVTRTLADGTKKTYHYPAYRRRKRKSRDSLEDLITAWQRSPQWDNLAKSTQEMYTRAVRPLMAMGAAKAADVDLADLVIIHNAIVKSAGPGAAAVFVRSASSLLTWGVRNGFLKTKPMLPQRIASRPLPTWTDRDVALAMEHLVEHLRRPLVLALYTGQRRGDLVRLRWDDYDGERITLVQEKTNKRLVVPCHPALKDELATWRRDSIVGIASTPILLNAHGRPWLGNSLSAQLCLALSKIPGFPAGRNIHGLRKLAAINLAHAGCTLHEIGSITGHKSLAMIQLYTADVVQERLATAAVFRLVTNANKRQET